MAKLFKCADAYLKECTWKDLALVKFCLCAVGLLIGLSIPKDKKKYPLIAASIVFVVTYVPLMTKFLRISKGVWEEKA